MPQSDGAAAVEPIKQEWTLSSEIERLAGEYNVSASDAAKIIQCESRSDPKAVGTNKTLAGEIWSYDISYWQINTFYWKEDMLGRGLDIYDPKDNLRAGFIIFSKYGAKPWRASAHCHQVF